MNVMKIMFFIPWANIGSSNIFANKRSFTGLLNQEKQGTKIDAKFEQNSKVN